MPTLPRNPELIQLCYLKLRDYHSSISPDLIDWKKTYWKSRLSVCLEIFFRIIFFKTFCVSRLHCAFYILINCDFYGCAKSLIRNKKKTQLFPLERHCHAVSWVVDQKRIIVKMQGCWGGEAQGVKRGRFWLQRHPFYVCVKVILRNRQLLSNEMHWTFSPSDLRDKCSRNPTSPK
jgi:hypothetical protein